MRIADQQPSWMRHEVVRQGSTEARVVQAIRDLVEMGRLPYTASIARHLHRAPGQVNRSLQVLLTRGRVVKGERVGSIVPYYLREQRPTGERG